MCVCVWERVRLKRSDVYTQFSAHINFYYAEQVYKRFYQMENYAILCVRNER